MPIVLAGLALAVTASMAQGVGYLCQQVKASQRPPVSLRRPLVTVASMLRSRWWRLGLLFAVTGFLLHLGALALAPISLVQAFVAGGLALVAPIAARVFHHRLTPAERRAVPLMALSLAALALGIASPARPLAFEQGILAGYLGFLVLAALLFSVGFKPPLRQPAIAAGLFYAALDSSTKGLADLGRQYGVAAAAASPFLIVAVAAAIAAFFCFQRALQVNRPLTAIAVMEAGATGGGVLAGFVAFGDPLGATPAIDALHLAAFIGVGIAVWILAPTQARLAEPIAATAPSRVPEVPA
jgi:hypothetical protein